MGRSAPCAESISTARGRGRARAQAASSPTHPWSSSKNGEPWARKMAGIAFGVCSVLGFDLDAARAHPVAAAESNSLVASRRFIREGYRDRLAMPRLALKPE